MYLTTRQGAGRVQVSSRGGNSPLWSHDGRELFYQSGRRLMSVLVPLGDSLDVGNSRVLFDGPYFALGRDPNFSVSPDGQRFLMLRPVATTSAGAEIVITLNWLEELKRLVPITKH